MKTVKFKILILIPIALILTFTSVAFALTPECIPSGTPVTSRADFLVTATNLIGKFGSAKQVCIVNHDRAAFISYKIPSFEDIKSIYYTQIKTPKQEITTIPTLEQKTYLRTGDLTISTSPTGSGTAVIFIDGKLTISSNITYGTSTTGLVLVSSGDVIIESAVTRVDAVIITTGTIFTSGNNCDTSTITTSQLVINGSLVSLNPLKSIKFCRKLANNTNPAEKINHQSKYVVILRNIFADTLQKWSELP